MEKTEAQSGKILVIDDSPHIREIASVLLTHAGYEVETEESGQSAYTRLVERKESFDLLLIDVSLDDIDGITLYRKIKEELPRQVFLIMSGYNEDDVISDSMNNDRRLSFLQKPFDSKTLNEIVSRMMKLV